MSAVPNLYTLVLLRFGGNLVRGLDTNWRVENTKIINEKKNIVCFLLDELKKKLPSKLLYKNVKNSQDKIYTKYYLRNNLLATKLVYIYTDLPYSFQTLIAQFEQFSQQQLRSSLLIRLKFKQAVGALGELSDKSDFSLLAWDSFSQEIRNLLLFYCQKSLNLLQMQ